MYLRKFMYFKLVVYKIHCSNTFQPLLSYDTHKKVMHKAYFHELPILQPTFIKYTTLGLQVLSLSFSPTQKKFFFSDE